MSLKNEKQRNGASEKKERKKTQMERQKDQEH